MGESCEVRITNLTDMTPEEFIRRKKIYDVALTSEQVDAMTQQFREAAAWIVGQNEAYIIEIYYRAAERIASGELSAAEARRVVREALEAAGYRADAPGSWRDLKDGTARQKLVLETNVNKAAGYAWRETVKGIASLPAQELVRFEQRDVPRDWVTRWRNAWAALSPEEQKKALPGPRMVALVECRIWNEISRWKDPYPPFDYNSGMDVLPVDAEEAEQLGLVLGEEVPRAEEAEDFGVKKELPESEHGADLREIEQWIKEMEAEIAAEDTRMRAEGIITNSARHANVRPCRAVKRRCPLEHKGTTREGETQPQKREEKQQAERQSIEQRYEGRCNVMKRENGQMEVQVYAPETSVQEAEKKYSKLIDGCRRVNSKGISRGVPGKGFVAPGMGQKEFYVSKKSRNEMVNKVSTYKTAASRAAHLTAATIVDALWESSRPLTTRRPKKGNQKDRDLEWVHERESDMKVGEKTYSVKLTGFEYKNKMSDPMIYHVHVSKKKRDHEQ